MTLSVTDDVSAEALARFGMLIDVRSPAEFAEDHVPGAVNLPVLTDQERAEVGTIYVQESRFTARRVGAAHVARNVARHLETALADQPGGFAPLVYCWRGGMRSNAMATILSQVGWRTTVLSGGYRTWRRHVSARLYDGALPHRFVLLDGPTGTAKTALLDELASRGAQVLDLEGLAQHRGSLFGGFSDRPQPAQKMFESRLLGALDALDPARLVVAEAESSKIGEVALPPALWSRLSEASWIEVAAEPEARARYLLTAYADITHDRARLAELIARIPNASADRRGQWLSFAQAGEIEALALALMAHHYDPAYTRARKKHGRPQLAAVRLDPADPASRAAAAAAIARCVSSLDAAPVGLDPER
jgi:tRNA 2-selenouridine synthase